MKWVRMGTRVNSDGTTITYGAAGTDYEIESRKRKVEHANRGGFWWHTTFWVVKDGKDIVQRWSLKDAKACVEKLEANT